MQQAVYIGKRKEGEKATDEGGRERALSEAGTGGLDRGQRR